MIPSYLVLYVNRRRRLDGIGFIKRAALKNCHRSGQVAGGEQPATAAFTKMSVHLTTGVSERGEPPGISVDIDLIGKVKRRDRRVTGPGRQLAIAAIALHDPFGVTPKTVADFSA